MYCRHVTANSHPVNNTSMYHPHQLPATTAAVSMTVQQKIYRLNMIEFDKPVIRELPAYIDVNDPRWSADPRVRPCIQHPATAVSEHTTTNGIGLSFYSSCEGSCGSDTGITGCVVQEQKNVSGAGAATSSRLSSTCDNVTADVATVHSSSAHESLSVECSPVNSVCNVNSLIKCENLPNLSREPENFAVGVVKAERDDSHNAAVARHTFQHNVSWLSVTRSSGIQKLPHAKN